MAELESKMETLLRGGYVGSPKRKLGFQGDRLVEWMNTAINVTRNMRLKVCLTPYADPEVTIASKKTKSSSRTSPFRVSFSL